LSSCKIYFAIVTVEGEVRAQPGGTKGAEALFPLPLSQITVEKKDKNF